MLKTVPSNPRVFVHRSGPLRRKNRNGKHGWTTISATSRRRGEKGVANQLFRGWPIRSRTWSQHVALTRRRLILYQASILRWRPRSTINEKLTHSLIMAIREVGLSCQTYGHDYGSSSPALFVSFNYAVLRYEFFFSSFFRSLPYDILGLSN